MTRPPRTRDETEKAAWPQPLRQDKGACIACRLRDWDELWADGERVCAPCLARVQAAVRRFLRERFGA